MSKAEAIGIIIILLLIGVMAYSAHFWAYNQEMAYYLLIRFILAFILLSLVWKIKFSQIKLIVVLTTAACLQAVLGIWQVITHRVFESKWLGMALQKSTSLTGESVIEYGSERLLRAYGSLPHPNILAGFLVVAFALLIYLVLKNDKTYQRWFLFSAFTLLTTGVFLTFSRSAWLVFVLAICFLFFVFTSKSTYETKRLSKALGAWVLLLLIVLTAVFWQPVKTRVVGESRLEQVSNTERVSSLQNSYYMARNSWPQGIGLGNYTHELRRLDRSKKLIYEYQPVHNVYMLIATELGVFGAGAMLLLLMYFVARLVASKEDQFTGHPLPLLIMGSAMGCVYILMLFDHYFFTSAFGIYLWFLVMGLFIKNIGIHKKEVLPQAPEKIEEKIQE